MKPVAIFQHTATVRPGYFRNFLDSRRIPWLLIDLEAGHPVPPEAGAFSGLCFMGGPMSANDALPWIAPELTLIREAVSHDIPVIGHCLGAQLMSRALGGIVTTNPVREIGWHPVRATTSAETRAWLGEVDEFEAYQWHGETFSLPPGASLILTGDACANQACVFGKHLGMQFHVEITETLIREWNETWHAEVSGTDPLPAGIQSPEQQMLRTLKALPAMREVAHRLYSRWILGLCP